MAGGLAKLLTDVMRLLRLQNHRMKRRLSLVLMLLSTAYAGGASPLAEAQLLKQRQKNVAAVYAQPELLQTGGMCLGLRYWGESKGGSVGFPVGRASPLYVQDRGVYYAFDFPKGQPRRLWCMGSASNPVHLVGEYRSPFWKAALTNLGGKGRQIGHFPDVALGLDIYWNFAGESYATRVNSAGKEMCQGLFVGNAAPFPPAVRWVCKP